MTFKKILPLAALLAVVLPAGTAMAAPKSKFRFTQADLRRPPRGQSTRQRDDHAHARATATAA